MKILTLQTCHMMHKPCITCTCAHNGFISTRASGKLSHTPLAKLSSANAEIGKGASMSRNEIYANKNNGIPITT